MLKVGLDIGVHFNTPKMLSPLAQIPTISNLYIQSLSTTDAVTLPQFTHLRKLTVRHHNLSTQDELSQLTPLVSSCTKVLIAVNHTFAFPQLPDTVLDVTYLLSNTSLLRSQVIPEKIFTSLQTKGSIINAWIHTETSDRLFLESIFDWHQRHSLLAKDENLDHEVIKQHHEVIKLLDDVIKYACRCQSLNHRQQEALFKGIIKIKNAYFLNLFYTEGALSSNFRLKDGSSIFYYAAVNLRDDCNLELFATILKNNHDPNIGNVPALFFVQHLHIRSIELTKMLLEAPIGANPNLEIASSMVSKLFAVPFIFTSGAPTCSLLSYMFTLYVNSKIDKTHFSSVVALAIKHGAKLNTKDDEGYSIAHYMAYSHSEKITADILKALISEGLDISARSKFESSAADLLIQSLYSQWKKGNLDKPFWHRKLSLLILLLENGATLHPNKLFLDEGRVSTTCPTRIMNWLLAAAHFVNATDHIPLLQKYCPTITTEFFTTFMYKNEWEAFTIYVKKHDVSTLRDRKGYTLLHHAARLQNIKACDLLTDKGLSIYTQAKARPGQRGVRPLDFLERCQEFRLQRRW